ncbi:prolyl oligopeptidase family serine peptidase [Akkermansiaceae bacterium]|nr:prolyl oligopeptidase family serine peptidase [Akkermansiaceae bacterium]MDB4406868.1 prolyl oligopeptidase family serine peptidase [Akkermansiaceae bacterium]
MIKFVLTLALTFPLAHGQGPDVAKLSEDLQKETQFLNPEYLVFSPAEKIEKPIPLIISLHGAGGIARDIRRVQGQVFKLMRGVEKFKKGPCYIVAPQSIKLTKEGGGWAPSDLNILLKHLKATLKIDEKRIYLTGNSMGGYGSWAWGGHNPEHFAAIAPISGGTGPGGPKDVTPDLEKWAANLAKVPVYAFVGAEDRIVPAKRSETMITAIKKAGGKEAKLKIFPEEGHGAGRLVLSSAEFFDWMFSQKR